MLKKSIPTHKRMAMGGQANIPLGYARGGVVAPAPNSAAMPAPVRAAMPAPVRASVPVSGTPEPMKRGGSVKIDIGSRNNVVKNPLVAARAGNGLRGMKAGGKMEGKKC